MFSLRAIVWMWRPRTAKRVLAMVIADMIVYFPYNPNETQDNSCVFESLVKSVHLLDFCIVLGLLRFCFIRSEEVVEWTPLTPSMAHSTIECSGILHTRLFHNRLSPSIRSISSNVTKTYRSLTNS